jgi:glycosyltransferase involved in cell wall biosynthesis
MSSQAVSFASTELVVVVPVYRNAGTLRELARRADVALSAETSNFRLLFVVDACPDDSWAVVRTLAQGQPRVAGLLLKRNVGQHAALLAGIAAIRARWYATMDADLQDPPELLPALLRLARDRERTVFACREGAYQSRGRMITSRFYKTLLERLAGLPARAGIYLIMPDAVAQAAIRQNVPHPQVVVLVRHFSPRWDTLSYRRAMRAEGESSYSAWGRVRAGARGLLCLWECRRGIVGKPWSESRAACAVNL